MTRGRAAIDAFLARPERVLFVVTHGNLMTLILRSFETQCGSQTREQLSNLDVYCVTQKWFRTVRWGGSKGVARPPRWRSTQSPYQTIRQQYPPVYV